MSFLFAIGDLHGEYGALDKILSMLEKLKILKRNPENTRFQVRPGGSIVFLGDYIDRGPENQRTLDTLIALESQCENVECLMGNHELLALADLGTARKIVQDASIENPKFPYKMATRHGKNGGWDFIKEFHEDPKIAMQMYVQAMHRDARYGKWIRERKPFVVKEVAGYKFLLCHAGVPADIEDEARIEQYALDFNDHMAQKSSMIWTEKYFESPLVRENSMFWIRGKFLNQPYAKQREHLDKLGVNFVVVGHTKQESGRIKNINNCIFDCDVEMSSAYSGNPPAMLAALKTKKKAGVYGMYHPGKTEELIAF